MLERIYIFEDTNKYTLNEFILLLIEFEKQGYKEINFDSLDVTIK